MCLRRPDGSELYDASITRVAFITLPDVLIERYVDTGEPMDKAGGYALQGIAGAFVSRIEGSPTGVIGLPLADGDAAALAGGIRHPPAQRERNQGLV